MRRKSDAATAVCLEIDDDEEPGELCGTAARTMPPPAASACAWTGLTRAKSSQSLGSAGSVQGDDKASTAGSSHGDDSENPPPGQALDRDRVLVESAGRVKTLHPDCLVSGPMRHSTFRHAWHRIGLGFLGLGLGLLFSAWKVRNVPCW